MTSFLTTGGIRGSKKSIDKFLPRSFNMGIKKNAFDEVDGFSDIRQYGEDLDLSYKLLFSGKKSGLIFDAKVYHKRRTTLSNFFQQMFKSGKGRHYLNLKYKGTFRFFHLFPTFFVLGLVNFLGLINFFEKVPKPRISTLLSRATASIIVSIITSIAEEIFSFPS